LNITAINRVKEVDDNKKQIEETLKLDRVVAALGLSGITAISWIYMVNMAAGVAGAPQRIQICCSPYLKAWNASNLGLIFGMWTVMMIAMMVPSESPIVIMFAAINRGKGPGRQLLLTAAFLLGYLAVWTVFGALATLAQWGLHAGALLSSTMMINSSIFGGALLFAAGIFQWTGLKYACLSRCRSPLGFLINEWREGVSGAGIMGMKHGIYCIGCCWLLMGLMFVAGVMNLLWMAVITVFVFLEKVVMGGFLISRFAGIVLIVWGMWMALGRIL
jgi:predicted metal-binding membrane protein